MSIKNSIQLEINSKKRRFCLSNSIPLHLHSIKPTNSESLACESNQIGEISNKNQREKRNPQEKSPQKKSNKSTAISQRNIPAKNGHMQIGKESRKHPWRHLWRNPRKWQRMKNGDRRASLGVDQSPFSHVTTWLICMQKPFPPPPPPPPPPPAYRWPPRSPRFDSTRHLSCIFPGQC